MQNDRIAGSNTGVGCTHFSIMLTNYLADTSEGKPYCWNLMSRGLRKA